MCVLIYVFTFSHFSHERCYWLLFPTTFTATAAATVASTQNWKYPYSYKHDNCPKKGYGLSKEVTFPPRVSRAKDFVAKECTAWTCIWICLENYDHFATNRDFIRGSNYCRLVRLDELSNVAQISPFIDPEVAIFCPFINHKLNSSSIKICILRDLKNPVARLIFLTIPYSYDW
jgi:hypothetical protein